MQSQLPHWLSSASEGILHGVSGRALTRDYDRLSAGYRAARPEEAKGAWLAYLAARLPATYAAVHAALSQVPQELSQSCQSLLDLGSGPGTACWAAADSFPWIKDMRGLEQDAEAIELASRLSALAPLKPAFFKADLASGAIQAEAADMVIAAYMANELEADKRRPFFDAAWSKADKLLVLVEPGTPLGFEVLLEARARLIDSGAKVLAPCPHDHECPLAKDPRSKWCHFSQRLERSRLSKLAKAGELGYEDERFAYLILAKPGAASKPKGSRVLGYPKKLEGQVTLELCSEKGLERFKATKRDKAVYKAARKAEWGDLWQQEP